MAFQSPQWGDNSKEQLLDIELVSRCVSVPAMGR